MASLERQLIATCLKAFCTYAERPNDPEKVDGDGLESGLCQPAIRLLRHLSQSIRTQSGDYHLIVKRLDDLVALGNEKFYAFPFKDVPDFWRYLFRSVSLLKFSVIALRGVWGQLEEVGVEFRLDGDQLDEMVRIIDMALIMVGRPKLDEPVGQAIDDVLKILQNIHESLEPSHTEEPAAKRRKIDIEKDQSDKAAPNGVFIPPVSTPIPKLSRPDIFSFQHLIQNPINGDLGPEPVVITGILDYWPARNESPWKSPSYLLSKTIGGRRLIPIELGRSYVDDGWGQKIITFQQFMNEYITKQSSPATGTGYLAQYDLFAQIPALRNDITVPQYCHMTPPPPHHSSALAEKHSAVPKLHNPLLNAWFGPAGTISPLHTDPYHNILAQVVGRKYVRLYAPRESMGLYARGVEDGGIDMENTSFVDVGLLEGWDGSAEEREDATQKFPLVCKAHFVDVVLEEGECLYIPVGWWHYVRSLSVSFSVSFWFN